MRTETRPANERDLDWLMAQLAKFDKASGFKRTFLESKEYARGGMTALINEHVVIVCESVRRVGPTDYPEFREPLGFIAGTVAGHPFNPNIRVLTELFWWVVPEHRVTRAGFLLLDEFTRIGRRSCDWIVFNVQRHTPVGRRHFERRGFVQKEYSFLLEV